MSEFSLLKLFLFWEVPELIGIGETIGSLSIKLIPVILIVAAMYAMNTHKVSYKTLLMRVFIAYSVTAFIGGYYEKVVFFGFEFGDEAIASKHSGVFKKWYDLKKDIERTQKNKTSKTLSVDSIRKIINVDISDSVEKFALFLIIIILQIVKILFTGSFYLSYCVIPIVVVISILPQFHNLIDGITRFLFWIILVPIVVSIIIVILGKLLDISVGSDSYIDSIMGIAYVLLASLGLLSSFKIAKMLISNGDMTGFAITGAGSAQNLATFAGASIMKDLVMGKSAGAIKSSAMMFSNPLVGLGLGLAKGTGKLIKDSIGAGQDILHDKSLDIKANKFTANQTPELLKSLNRDNQLPYSKNVSKNIRESYKENGSLTKSLAKPSNFIGPIKESIKNRASKDRPTYELDTKEKVILAANKLFNGDRNSNYENFKKEVSENISKTESPQELRNRDIVELYRNANSQRELPTPNIGSQKADNGGIRSKHSVIDDENNGESDEVVWTFSFDPSESNEGDKK